MSAAWALHGDLSAVPPAEARRIAETVREPWRQGGPWISAVTDAFVSTPRGPVRVRLYDPAPGQTKPAFLYLHGGGWMLFSLDTHDRVMREYAERAQVLVIGVDYALAPEAKYPVALEQVAGVAAYVAEHAKDIGIDARRIAIGGDSAGANLAVAACLRLRDDGAAGLICAMVLNYGVFERHSTREAKQRFGGPGAMLTAEEMDSYWNNYLRDERDAKDPLAVPVLANLRGLPQTLLIVPECDLLTEQSFKLAARLRAAEVPFEMKIYHGATHSFLEAVSISPLAGRAFDETAAWLRATLAS